MSRCRNGHDHPVFGCRGCIDRLDQDERRKAREDEERKRKEAARKRKEQKERGR